MADPRTERRVVEAINERALGIAHVDGPTLPPDSSCPEQCARWPMAKLEPCAPDLPLSPGDRFRGDDDDCGEQLVRQVPVVKGRPTADVTRLECDRRDGPRINPPALRVFCLERHRGEQTTLYPREPPLSDQVAQQSARARWLEPATDATLVRLARSGVGKVAVIAPGFAADCLETLEEMAMRGRETFLEAGGSDFAYLPCLNDSAIGIEMLRTLLARELAGWIGGP